MSLTTILRSWLRALTPKFVAHAASATPEYQRLDQARSLRFDGACGRTLHCFAGSLWITHDGDPKDVIVEAGQSYPVASRRRMIVHALCNSSLRMR